MASSTVRPEDHHQDRSAGQDVARRLLDSAAKLSYDPAAEVDWDTPWTRTTTARAPSGARSTGRRTGRS